MECYNDGRFSGGPSTLQVVEDRKRHKCHRIWNGDGDYKKKISTRYHGQVQYKMMSEENNARRQKLHDIGLGIIIYRWIYTDVALCFALAERFWPKTNTFHFSFGEMCITLEDIYYITGLPITGAPLVIYEGLDDYTNLIYRCLGKIPEGVNMVEACNKGKIKMKWLIEEFSNLPPHATEEEVNQYTRAYLLAWCGNCLFPNSTGMYVSAIYLRFIEELDNVTTYAWGPAILAYLLKSLSEFVLTMDAYDLRGFTPILQFRYVQNVPGEPRTWSRNISGKGNGQELRIAVDAWNRRIESEFQVQGMRKGDNAFGVINGATQDYCLWYGNPKIHNIGVRYDEPRFVPRGYGDEATNLLWGRCNDSAVELSTLCDQFAHGWTPTEQFIDHVRAIADRLRSPLPGGVWPLPREDVTASIRVVGQHQATPENPEEDAEPYVPQFVDEQRGDEDDEENEDDGSDENSGDDEGSGNYDNLLGRTYEYGASSSTQRPHTPTYSHPPHAPMEPTQDIQLPRRSRRTTYRIPYDVLQCPYCSTRGRTRCPNHHQDDQ